MIFIDFSIDRLSNASTQGPKSDPKHLTLDFYCQTDLGLHLSGVFSSRYTVWQGAVDPAPLNLLFNLDLKAAVKNVHELQQVLQYSGKLMLSLF